MTDALPEIERRKVRELDQEPEEEAPEKKPLLPAWVTLSIFGSTAIIVGCIAARYYFTYVGGLRSYWALGVFVVGFLMAVGAHLVSSIASINSSQDSSLADIILHPIEMWRSTIRELPKTGKRIVCGTCGVTAFLSAYFIIGGINFASIFVEPWVAKDLQDDVIADGTRAAQVKPGDGPDSMEENLNDVEKRVQGSMIDPDAIEGLPSPDQPLDCTIYGFTKDGNQLARILFCATVEGETRHVAAIEAKALSPKVQSNLTKRLRQLITSDRPSFQTRYFATWVRPALGLKLSFDGWSTFKEMVNPRLYIAAREGATNGNQATDSAAIDKAKEMTGNAADTIDATMSNISGSLK